MMTGEMSRRLLALGLAVCAATLLPAGRMLTLCCRSDGSIALEQSLYGQCAPALARPSSAMTGAGYTPERNPCGGCVDSPVFVGDAAPPTAHGEKDSPQHLAATEALAPGASRAPVTPERDRGGWSIQTPPISVLALLRTVVLLV